MADYNLANLPSVSISRSKFNRTQSHNLSFNLGELRVLQCQEVIPGSTHKLEYGSLIRMSTPIAPIMDDIQYDIFTFFCPIRLTWSNWKRFMGENTTGAGAINGLNSDKTIPMTTVYGSGINTLADDMGIPGYASGNRSFDVSVLPFRACYLIKDRWFRNQNVESPSAINLGDTVTSSEIIDFGLESSSSGGQAVRKFGNAYKLPDYFTSALPYAQKGDPVSIFPAGAQAPVLTGTEHDLRTSGIDALKLRNSSGGFAASGTQLGVNGTGGLAAGTSTIGTTSTMHPTNLWANLGASVNATINDLRFAFQLQKFLEKDALYGSRYWEILHAHYAVTSPDATLQDPQLIGHVKFDINIQQVLQTTGFTDPTSTNLGTPGANSTTGSKGHLCTASFVEHGYLITIGVARQKRHTYSQGLNRMWSRSVRTDFYFPVFANLGAQKVYDKEIDVQSSTPNNVFGYQEAWADYRFLPSYNSGLLNPTRPSALDYWTLADKYSSTPTLGVLFLKEDRTNLARALVTGAGGPDFIGSFYFRDTTVNPMPVYSIPGFADHH